MMNGLARQDAVANARQPLLSRALDGQLNLRLNGTLAGTSESDQSRMKNSNQALEAFAS